MANVIVIASPKAGSITVKTNNNPLRCYSNLKNVTVSGDNPFKSDGTTLNPLATIYITVDRQQYILKDVLLTDITTIGGTARPATLDLTIAAINALIAE